MRASPLNRQLVAVPGERLNRADLPAVRLRNWVGGFTWDGNKLSVNGEARIVPLSGPDRFAATAFEAGSLPQKLLGARRRGGHASHGRVRLARVRSSTSSSLRRTRAHCRSRRLAAGCDGKADLAERLLKPGLTRSNARSRPRGAIGSTASNSRFPRRPAHDRHAQILARAHPDVA